MKNQLGFGDARFARPWLRVVADSAQVMAGDKHTVIGIGLRQHDASLETDRFTGIAGRSQSKSINSRISNSRHFLGGPCKLKVCPMEIVGSGRSGKFGIIQST